MSVRVDEHAHAKLDHPFRLAWMHRSHMGSSVESYDWFLSSEADTLLAFVADLFEFVDECLAEGGNVLVHCLAGAHRAGTSGCLLLMYKHGVGAQDAIKAAKRLRPIINPIGSLPGLLLFFEKHRDQVCHR